MKKFRLLLMMSSLLALVCSFTACNTDITDDYPVVSLSLEAGEVEGNTLTFTVKATGADDIYYWVEAVEAPDAQPAEDADDAEDDKENQLDLEGASYLDAQPDQPFEQEVTVTVKYNTEYVVRAFAKNFAHNAYANEITMATGAAPVVAPAPEVSAEADEEEVYEDSFLVWVTTKNAAKAAWLVVPKYTEGVDAAKVFAEGVEIPASELNGEAAAIVEDLTPDTEYDFYAAAENVDGVQVLSAVVAVTTAKKEIPVLEFNPTELMSNTNLFQSALALPGAWITLSNPQNGVSGTLFMYDLSTYPEYAGYLSDGVYPALGGSLDAGSLPQATCLLADPGYTNFVVGETEYYPVGDMGVDGDDNPYGVSIMTQMPNGVDNNLLEFNIPVQDASGNLAILRGQYIGPLGYSVTPATIDLSLAEWSFTKYVATVEGNTVTLTSSSINGKFEMVLTTENGDITEGAFIAGDGEGANMTGGYTSFVETEEFFGFISGRIAFEKVDDNGNYKLYVAYSREGQAATVPDWIMQGQSCAYKIVAPEAGYDITIEWPAAEEPETLSIDGKQWQLPAEVVMNVVGAETVGVADLGVSAPGQLLVGFSLEPVYGAEAAGQWQVMIATAYSVEATDATSGNIVLTQTNMYDEVTTTLLPYSNLTAESVTIDFTNMGVGGVSNCTLYTGNAPLSAGGGIAQ